MPKLAQQGTNGGGGVRIRVGANAIVSGSNKMDVVAKEALGVPDELKLTITDPATNEVLGEVVAPYGLFKQSVSALYPSSGYKLQLVIEL